MIDLYALTSPNVQKIYIALEELELPYCGHFVDVWKSEQFAANFVRLNPNSKVPVIVDQDGPGGEPYTIFESGAILLYLADQRTSSASSAAAASRTEPIVLHQMTKVSKHPRRCNRFSRLRPISSLFNDS